MPVGSTMVSGPVRAVKHFSREVFRVGIDVLFGYHNFIGLDKSGYPVNIFLISPRKHVLWVLIRSASPRCF